MFSFAGFLKGLLIQNEVDRTKQVAIESSSASTTSTRTTITTAQTANRTITLPDATTTLVGTDTTQTLTNKTIDASLNTITGVTSMLDDIGTTQGDILYRDASTWTVLPAGTSGQVLTTGGTGANPAWASSLTNPMTTAGDIIVADVGGTPDRLPIGSTEQILSVNSAGALIYRNQALGSSLAFAKAIASVPINISSAPATFDGGFYTASSGDHIVVTNQSTSSQNGLYTFNGTGVPMTRVSGWDVSVPAGRMIYVQFGRFTDTIFVVSQAVPTVGTSAFLFQCQSANKTSVAVRVVADTQIALTGSTPLVIDNVTLVNGHRVMLDGQGSGVTPFTSDPANGIYEYVVSGGSYSLVRAPDWKTTADFSPGRLIPTETNGAQYGRTLWTFTEAGINVGTDSIFFREVGFNNSTVPGNLTSWTDGVHNLGSSTNSWNSAYMRAAKITGTINGTVTLVAPSAFTNYTLVLPNDNGTPDQVLTTDGAGSLSWTSKVEPVNASYANSTTTVNNNSSAFVIYTTQNYDTHNAYNTSTGEYTVPVAGKYHITASGRFSSDTSTAGAPRTLEVWKNGSIAIMGPQFTVISIIAGSPTFTVTGTLDLSVNDIIQIRATQSSTGASRTMFNTTPYAVFFNIDKIAD